MSSFLSTPTTGLLEKLVVFGERRHEALAGNIANIQTPGYRMRDLPVDDFQKALQQAVAELQSPKATKAPIPATADPASIPGPPTESLFPDRLFQASKASPHNLTFQDANNRSVEHQMSQLIKNTMMQKFAMEMLRFQYNALQTVVSEQP